MGRESGGAIPYSNTLDYNGFFLLHQPPERDIFYFFPFLSTFFIFYRFGEERGAIGGDVSTGGATFAGRRERSVFAAATGKKVVFFRLFFYFSVPAPLLI